MTVNIITWVAERSGNPFPIINMFGVSVSNSGPQRVDCVKGTSQHISCVKRSALVLEGVMKIICYSRCYIIPIKQAEIDRSNERSPGEVGGLCACGG